MKCLPIYNNYSPKTRGAKPIPGLFIAVFESERQLSSNTAANAAKTELFSGGAKLPVALAIYLWLLDS